MEADKTESGRGDRYAEHFSQIGKTGNDMRRIQRSGNFFFCLLINMLMNPEGFILAAVLLVLHFVLGLSLWWTYAALGLWIFWLIIRMCLIGWAVRCGSVPDPKKENKNPYSVRKIQKKQ